MVHLQGLYEREPPPVITITGDELATAGPQCVLTDTLVAERGGGHRL